MRPIASILHPDSRLHLRGVLVTIAIGMALVPAVAPDGSGLTLAAGEEAQEETDPTGFQPPVSRDYSDLTAMFRLADYVPSMAQRADTLAEFLLSEAPDSTGSDAERLAPYESLPKVGDPAPDFEIVDVAGHRHRVSEYRGKKQLALVFSRANW